MTSPRLPSRLLAVLCLVVFSLLGTARFSPAAEGVSKGYPEEYKRLMNEVIHCYFNRDFRQALKLLDKADQIVPDTPMALNSRAAIAIEERHFADGERYCKEALAKDPKFLLSRFNLAEIPFLQKNYDAARKVYRELLEEYPEDEMIQFRIYLTYLLEKDEAGAKKRLDEFKFPSTTGAYYYAHAAWEFAHENPSEGHTWVRSGDWVFSPSKDANFAAVFYDLGWLDRPKPKLTPESADAQNAEAPEGQPARGKGAPVEVK
jgi:tetratricopeptide (TPR) repeat protein